MKQSILKRILILAVMMMTVGSFTSCKDYDDDIDNLKKENTQQDKQLQELTKNLEAHVANLKSLIKGLEDKLVEANKKIEENKKKGEINAEQIAKALIRIKANEDMIASLKVKVADLETELGKLKALHKKDIAEIREELKKVKARIDALEKFVKEQTKKNTEFQKALDKLQEDLAKCATKEELNAAVKEFNKKIDDLDKKYKGITDALDKKIDDLQADMDKKFAKQKAEYEKLIEDLRKEYKEAIKDFVTKEQVLKYLEKYTTTEELLKLLEKKLDVATFNKFKELYEKDKEAFNQKITELQNKDKELDKAIKALAKKTDEELAKKVDKDSLAKTLENYATIEYVDDEIELVQNDVDDLTDRVKFIEDNYASKQQLQDSIASLRQEVVDEVKRLDERIDDLEDNLDDLEYYIDVLSMNIAKQYENRITDMEFIPEYHVNGIPAMEVNYVVYNRWKDVGTVNEKQETSALYLQHNGSETKTARFNLNPASVTPQCIKSIKLEFVKSKNRTRSTSSLPDMEENPPLNLLSWKIEKGILIVNMVPNSRFYHYRLEKGEKEFVMFRVVITQNIEIEKPPKRTKKSIDNPLENPVLRSEYIMLDNEIVKVPKLHSLVYKDKNEDFVGYKDLTDSKNKLLNASVIKKHNYLSGPLDVSKLVNVYLVNQGTTEPVSKGQLYAANQEELDKYGLEIQYSILKKTVKTDQFKEGPLVTDYAHREELSVATDAFGTIDSKGILKWRNVSTYHSIGFTPIVQIRLVDKKSKNIVDVRYLPVRWYANDEIIDVLFSKEVDYDCNGMSFQVPVDMKELLPHIVKGGSLSSIYQLYNAFVAFGGFNKTTKVLEYRLFDTKGKVATDMGKLEVTLDLAKNTLKGFWKLSPATNHKIFLEAMKNKGKFAEFKVMAKMETRNQGGIAGGSCMQNTWVSFGLKLKVNFKPAKLAAGYFEPYWNGNGKSINVANEDKSFLVNPILISDATYGKPHFQTCQILADILTGYNKNGKKITDILQLSDQSPTASVWFEFDYDRMFKKAWKVKSTPAGQVLEHFTYGATATITPEGIIQLAETSTPAGQAGSNGTYPAILVLYNIWSQGGLPIKVVANTCENLNFDLDHFLVKFVKPLDIQFNTKDLKNFEDFVAGGCTIDVSNVVTVKEAFGNAPKTIYKNGTMDAEYGAWYGVKQPVWELSETLCNLELKNGNIVVGTSLNKKLKDFSSWFELKLSTDGRKLTFHNKSGVALQKPFKLKVPISVKTKWGHAESSKSYAIIEVNLGKK